MLTIPSFRLLTSGLLVLAFASPFFEHDESARRPDYGRDNILAMSAVSRLTSVHTTRVAARTREVIGDHSTPTVIDNAVVWRAGRIYELAGPLIVKAGGTLTIEPGTRVEARPGSTIEITRDGRIHAEGTLLQPIVLTCTSVPKYEGCWGGLSLRGFASLNFGSANSPAVRGNGAAGCLQTGVAERAYGGCDDADSSGVIRYTRVEYAADGLRLYGVGSRTVVDFVQVNRSRTDGLGIVGGSVDLRHAFLTANFGYGLSWRSGWRGRGQFIAVQQDPAHNTGGIFGSNIGGNPSALTASPRSAPSLFNVTVVAPSDPANPGNAQGPSAIHLAQGTGGTLRNVLLYSPAIAFDVDDAETCNAGGNAPAASLANVVIAGARVIGNPDGDPVGCGYTTPNVETEWLADPLNGSVLLTDVAQVAALIRNGTDLIVPDLRPTAGGITTTTSAAAPPPDGFFDVAATYVGAIPSANVSRNNVPWYSGWTVPAPLAPPPGSASGIVASTVTGAFGGAVVSASFGAADTTAADGMYSLVLPAGQHLLTASSLPIGCDATPVAVTVASGVPAIANIAAECTFIRTVVAGALHACAQTTEQRVQCWGQNDYGMVGDGTLASPRALPLYVSGDLLFADSTLTSGYTHSCALRSGAALCWGLNFFGALGLGSSGLAATTPVAAGNTSTPSFVAISAGGYHTCALTGSGEAWCWGWNQEGQVGISGIPTVVTPTAVNAGALRFTKISAGESHTCALTAAGAAYCWGGNGRGELGSDPATTGLSSSVPILVQSGAPFASIDAGTLHTCALLISGEAQCWGSQEQGQLGNGAMTGIAVGPVSVTTTARFVALSAGGYTTCGVTTTNQLLCWGSGVSGSLGNGTQTAVQSLPVPVSGGLSAASVSVNLSDTASALVCATTVTGTVFCWGAGASGQLGIGALTALSATPVQVIIRGP